MTTHPRASDDVDACRWTNRIHSFRDNRQTWKCRQWSNGSLTTNETWISLKQNAWHLFMNEPKLNFGVNDVAVERVEDTKSQGFASHKVATRATMKESWNSDTFVRRCDVIGSWRHHLTLAAVWDFLAKLHFFFFTPQSNYPVGSLQWPKRPKLIPGHVVFLAIYYTLPSLAFSESLPSPWTDVKLK